MSTGSAIEVETAYESSFEEKATGTHGPSAAQLRQVAAERLAAHRRRRAAAEEEELLAQEQAQRNQQRLETARRAAAAERIQDQRRGLRNVAETVAARYRNTESYREYLANEAERALAQAQAEAEAAAEAARVAAEAQLQAQLRLIQEIEQFNRPEPGPREVAMAAAQAEVRGQLAHALADIAMGAQELMAEPPLTAPPFAMPEASASGLAIVEAPRQPVREISASGLTVRLYEDIPPTPARRSGVQARRGNDPVESPALFEAGGLAEELDEEIAFRRAPEFEPIRFETTPIPGNLIEFPRELVATKKARPRLAEGPLLDDPGNPQLRIFEVAPELPETAPDVQITTPAFDFEASYAPAWQNMMLEPAVAVAPAADEDAAPQAAAQHYPERHQDPHRATLPLEPCGLERRLMAIAVDGLCLLGAFAAFATAVAWVAGPALQTMTLPVLAMSAAGMLAAATLLYQVLFFTFSDATPGMRFARVSLCTFADGFPSRRAMRRRVVATALAALPVGMGILWMFMDEDGLGWHDRVSRMYLRAC